MTTPADAAPRSVRGLAARLAPAALVAVAAVAVGLTAVLDVLVTGAERATLDAGFGTWSALTGAVLVVSAAVVLAGRPGHRVGLVLAALGVVWAVDGVLESWSAYAHGHGAPGVDFAVWFVWRFGAFLLFGLPALLVFYPTGRLMSGRAGRVSIAVLIAAAGLPTMLVLAPDSVVLEGLPADVHTDLLALPLSHDVAVGLLTVTQVVTFGSLAAAFGVVYVRHRRADRAERTQLRWLLWGGIMSVLTVLALVGLDASGLVVNVLLTAAVTTTAVSVAIGVLRPDLGDVDALVAWTLTSAGVAAVVVAFDLAVLAGASALLGDRLDERNVTVAVLVLAVVVYGPLRAWLGAGVGRLLFGRRGDRYGVVSTFAARLECTRSVEEQLPALAEAVASTFKVAFVRVEVFAPGGATLSASHGAEETEVQRIDIAYTGERIGRLELPVLGVRSMLSRRDQGLLVDLVRQAAIAIRVSLLADEVQGSRERLVLGREEDRRRIRRDLHDGLGPVLGGVAMRLDAAGNAVEADPASARRLIHQSRTEIREALDDVRRLVHDLRPPALDDLGLLAAIEQQAERASSQLRVDVDAGDLGGLPAAVEVAAYRIVSESLANALRHAAATRCVVRLEPGPTALEVVVRDDGRGIAADVAAGVGLLSLRERAEELGGQAEVTCPESGGTQVRAWLPYGAERVAAAETTEATQERMA